METIGDRLKRLREAKRWSQAKLARESGLKSQGTIGNIEAGTRGYGDSVVGIALALNTSPQYLLCDTDDPGPAVHVISGHIEFGDELEIKALAALPLVGEIKGGPDGFLEELNYPVGHGEGTVQHPTSDPKAYALRVRGDSMHPRYRAGEFVIVEPSVEPQQGDDVVVLCRDGRKLLKELGWKRDGEVNLRSINNGYDPITLRLDEIESIQLAAARARRSALKRP